MGIRQSTEDTTQESVLKAFKKINQYRGGSFRGWLFKIVTNTCYNELA
jgi:RNA polymerase sigma-70 factor, ECF subfamily